MKNSKTTKRTTVCVKGMHCASCDLLVASKFNELNNIKVVKADHVSQKVEIEYQGELDKKKLENSIKEYGYTIVNNKELDQSEEPFLKRIFDAVLLGMIVVILFFLATEFNLIPTSMLSTLTLSSAFFVGVVASLSTCMATTGALYLATIGKLHDVTATFKQKMVPAVSFNLGRILTYTIMGALNGFVGQVLTKELKAGSSLNIVIGLLMIFVGLDMLKILPFDRIIPGGWYKNFLLKLETRLLKHPRRTSFLLGAITYWLPCGFTQSVQLYALAVADPFQSALIMLSFALGTTPVLLAMGYATSVLKSKYYLWFMKAIAVIVTLVGFWYVSNALSLYGLNPLDRFLPSSVKSSGTSTVEEINGEQVIRMKVTYQGYTPDTFTVQKGKPVKWIIEGVETFGCQGYLLAPKINIETVLRQGENIITFFPEETGKIGFSCSMGMYRGQILVI